MKPDSLSIRIVIFGLTAMLLSVSCTDYTDLDSVSVDGLDAEYAIPLINSTITIQDAIDASDQSVSARVDPDGKVTLSYSGEVLRQDANFIFPAFPGVLNIPVTDTIFLLPLPLDVDFTVRKSVFKNSNAYLNVRNTLDEPINVSVHLPDLILDGEPLTFDLDLAPETSFSSGPTSIKGFTLFSNFDEIEIRYTATTASGERVLLDDINFGIDLLSFTYAEGFFGSRVYDIRADVIPVGIFEPWESGGIDFTDPKVTLQVDNAFGFPVQTVVRQLELVTLTDEVRSVESDFIDSGIIFNFPDFDNIGGIERTDFAFTAENSNIQIVFNERIKQVKFDIDALAFPDNDEETIGFATDSSFFAVSVAVELPLLGTIDDLVVSDTIAYDLSDITDDIAAAELKLLLNNSFPFSITLDALLVDDAGQIVGQLNDNPIEIPASESSISNGAIFTDDIEHFINLDENRLELLKQSKRMLLRLRLDTPDDMNDARWLLSDYGIQARIGAKIKVRRQ